MYVGQLCCTEKHGGTYCISRVQDAGFQSRVVRFFKGTYMYLCKVPGMLA